MFSVNPKFNAIRSYDQAAEAWQKGVIFPKDRKLHDPFLPRGLVDTRKRHMTIERTEGKNFILFIYSTGVVTWHPDNSLTIRPYSTRSTVIFANRCTPTGMFVAMTANHFSVTSAGRTYRVDGWTTFRQMPDDSWAPDQITPWRLPVVNRERAARALRDIGYKEFRLWFKVYVQMALPSRIMWAHQIQYRTYTENHKVLTMLRDRSQWRDLVGRLSQTSNNPDQILNNIRQAIYREYDCTEHKDVPYLKSNFNSPGE